MVETRAKRLIAKVLLEKPGFMLSETLADLIVDTLSEADFLTREALNPPQPTDNELIGAAVISQRWDLAE